jgi:hypothetical protein
MTRSEFVLRSAIFVAIALAPFLIWLLFNVIVLATGAVLVATLIHLVATPFIKLRLPRGLALALSGLLIASVIGATFYLFGRTMASEFHDVLRSAEEAADSISLAISRSGLSDYLPKSFSENISLSGVIGRSFTISVEAVLGALVAFFAGVFLASEPALYSEGFTLLFAPRWRNEARETLGHVSTALRRWLLGQMIEMVTVGVMAGVAVWLIGLRARRHIGAFRIHPLYRADLGDLSLCSGRGDDRALCDALDDPRLPRHSSARWQHDHAAHSAAIGAGAASAHADFDRDIRNVVWPRRHDLRRAADRHHLCRGDQAIFARYFRRADAAAGGARVNTLPSLEGRESALPAATVDVCSPSVMAGLEPAIHVKTFGLL